MNSGEPIPETRRDSVSGANSNFGLQQLQRWLYGAITGSSVSDGDDSERISDSVADHVAPSHALSSEERLEIYQRAYVARLIEVLREEYSVLCRAFGTELFDQFAMEYLRVYPSESYTLARLGDRFVEFLEATRPAESDRMSESNPESDENPIGNWADFFIDLARLEQTVNQVFDGPGNENLPPFSAHDLAKLSADDFATARLIVAPCVRLLETRFPVDEYFAAILRDERPAIPRPDQSYVAVSRRSYRTERRSLTRSQYTLLATMQAGVAVGDALAVAAEMGDEPIEKFANQIERWFADWTAAGFFLGYEYEAAKNPSQPDLVV